MNSLYNAAESVVRPGNGRRYPFSARIVSGISMALDSAVLVGTGFITHALMVGWSEFSGDLYLAAFFLVWLLSFMLFHFAGLYQLEAITRPVEYWDKIIVALAMAFLLLLAIAFSLKVSAIFSRKWMYVYGVSACSAVIVTRLLVYWIVARLSALNLFARNVVVVGGGEQGRRLLSHLNRSGHLFLSVAGVFDDKKTDGSAVEGHPVLGGVDDLLAYARAHRVDDVILALPWSADERLLFIVEKLRELPINIYLSSDLVGFRLNLRPSPSHFGDVPLLEVVDKPLSDWSVVLKTLEDYVLGTVLLVLFSPVLLAVAAAIRLDSPGPILFRQRRLGFNNQEFDIYKFRSMRDDPDRQGRTVQAKRDDPRVTRVGRFIRRTSLDELPQLLNVLNGTMSLVGPRPHAVDHNEGYASEIRGYFARHRVKPGITGWAQVNGLRGETQTIEKMEARVRHDIFYTENWSLMFDLKILAMTAIVWLSGKNAY